MIMIKLEESMWVSYLHIVKVVAGGGEDCWVTLSTGNEVHVNKSAEHVAKELGLCQK